MAVCQQLLEILSDGRFHSGPAIGATLGVSRSAIWKQIQFLKKQGLELYTVPGKGYRLANSLELLRADAIRAAMSPSALQQLAGLEIHFQLDSTNNYLRRQEASGLPSYTACIAETQTAGRGRQSRHWVSGLGGGLYLSLLWRSALGFSELGGLSLVIGIGVLRALRQSGIQNAGIKWPNDILWQGRKLGGVLLDVSGESSGPCSVIIGTGINFRLPAEAMQTVDQPWVDLCTITRNSTLSRNQLAGLVLEQIIDVLHTFQESGLTHFMEEWQQYDLVAGQPVRLTLSDSAIAGVAQGIDASGALLMNTDGVQRRFTSGEISLRLAP